MWELEGDSALEVDIRDFLRRFDLLDLARRGVLRIELRGSGVRHLLRKQSVDPLLDLMREHHVTRLVADDRNWYLADNGEFSNPRSEDHNRIRAGNVSQLRNPGNVFMNQNRDINPYFEGIPSSEESLEERNTSLRSLSLERDLQRALRDNIDQLEPGLTIIDGGIERTVEAGRIDITAEDTDGNLVVIELKAGKATLDSIGQLQSYMGSIENPQEKSIRGILVAYDFDARLIMAASAVPNVVLKSYSFQFVFEDR